VPEFALVAHPATPSKAVTSIIVRVDRPRRGQLSLQYRVLGAIDGIAWPASAIPAFADRLWEHSCFEAFIGGAGEPGYVELNIASSTEWAAYAFDGYRSGMRRAGQVRFDHIAWWHGPDVAELRAWTVLPDLADLAVWRLGLSVVIEEKDGGKSRKDRRVIQFAGFDMRSLR